MICLSLRAAPYSFRQHDRSVFICVEGINGLLAGIMDSLRHIFAVRILQFESGIGNSYNPACLGIHLNELQAVTNSFIPLDSSENAISLTS